MSSQPIQRSGVKPPMKGAFPLDHLKECSKAEMVYLSCIKRYNGEAYRCNHLIQRYLKCRMCNELMREEPMDKLGMEDLHLGCTKKQEIPGKLNVDVGEHVQGATT